MHLFPFCKIELYLMVSYVQEPVHHGTHRPRGIQNTFLRHLHFLDASAVGSEYIT